MPLNPPSGPPIQKPEIDEDAGRETAEDGQVLRADDEEEARENQGVAEASLRRSERTTAGKKPQR